MIFESQSNALEQFNLLVNARRQSVLIDGPAGCGKSYLAAQYAELANIRDILEVQPTVSSVRDAIVAVNNLQSPVAVIVENLDSGLPAASHTLLKLLEEPSPNVYVIVTCRNIRKVPDTIVSRSAVVSVGPPTRNDLDLFARSMNSEKYIYLKQHRIWSVVKSFTDAINLLNMPVDTIQYMLSDISTIQFRDNVSTVVWNLNHTGDGKEIDPVFVVKYLLSLHSDDSIYRRKCVDALKDLEQNRIAAHAVLSKFVLDMKYGD